MKKYFLTIILMFISSVLCAGIVFAENWYAVGKYQVTDNDNSRKNIRMVTKALGKNNCYRVMVQLTNLDLKNVKWINSECVTGKEFDAALSGVFNKTKAQGLYMYFVDANGYETIVDFPDNPSEECIQVARTLKADFMKLGYKDIQIIIPEYIKEGKKQIPLSEKDEYLTRSSTKNEVEALQGKPDRVVGNVWFYGYDYIEFNKDGKITEFSNVLGELKIR